MSEIRHITADGTDAESQIHPVRALARAWDQILADVGIESDLESELSHPEKADVGITPDLSETVDNIIQDGTLPFSLRDELERRGADGEGSENVTALFVLGGKTLRETVEELADTGQLESAIHLFRNMRAESDPDPETLVAYTGFTYSKGWVAEQMITAHRDFSKLWISNDEKGQDARFEPTGAMTQIKAVTAYATGKKSDFTEADVDYWFYQWTYDGLYIGPTEEANEVNGRVSDETGFGKTALKKSYDGADLGDRSYRILWW